MKDFPELLKQKKKSFRQKVNYKMNEKINFWRCAFIWLEARKKERLAGH